MAQKLGLCAASGVRRSGRDEICGKRAVDDEAALSADGENGQRVFDPLQHARIALIGPAGVLKTPRLSTSARQSGASSAVADARYIVGSARFTCNIRRRSPDRRPWSPGSPSQPASCQRQALETRS